jgi:hypothetical protein
MQTILGRQAAQPPSLQAEERTLRILRTALRTQPATVRFMATTEVMKE